MSTLQAIPLLKGYSGSSGSQTWHKERWLIIGTDNRLVAQNTALANTDEYIEILNGNLLPRNVVEYEQLGDQVFVITVNWGSDQNKDNKDPTFRFDTGGGSIKMEFGLQTVGKYSADPDNDPCPDFLGAVGVNDNFEVEGVEIPAPAYNWSEKHFLSSAIVTPQYRKNLTSIKTCTNNSPFRGLDIDQVFFRDVKGSKSGQGLWEMDFDFSAASHIVDATFGGISGISKKAWDHIAFLKVKKNVSPKVVLPVPRYAVVTQLFYQADFSQLGIGVGARDGGS